MRYRVSLVMVLPALLCFVPNPAPACSLCASQQILQTFREEAMLRGAKIIVYGSVARNPKGSGDVLLTDINIEAVLRDNPFLKDKKRLQVKRFIPVTDPKDPPKFLLFCDIFNEQLDDYRGVPVKSKDVVAYVSGALKLPQDDRAKMLRYFADYLEHPDPAIAADAFLEFAKSTDREIGQLAGKIPAARLRSWLKNSDIPANRLSLYGFMLGSCGGGEDADLLRSMLYNSSDRTSAAFDGLLTGYIQLQPKEGWELAYATLQDPKKSYTSLQGVVRCLRFFHGWKPADNRTQILRGMEIILARNDLADLAIEDLRRWQEWDLTAAILTQFGKKGFDAPIMRRAIVRYALCCTKPEAKQFVENIKRTDSKLVSAVEESLEFEKKPLK